MMSAVEGVKPSDPTDSHGGTVEADRLTDDHGVQEMTDSLSAAEAPSSYYTPLPM